MLDGGPDPMTKWTIAPDWSVARLTRPGWTGTPVSGLFQTLLSGDLDAAFASFDPRPASVGLWEIASPSRAAIRIAWDRALLVSTEPTLLTTGWRAGGWAASDASDAWSVIDIVGAQAPTLVAGATSADLGAASPSASILFASVPALLYRLAPDHARLHVESSLAPYLWRWLETS
jgi:sarcosine oxidase gamma subunit